jgi:DNA-binding YbaB/EbfC family protein
MSKAKGKKTGAAFRGGISELMRQAHRMQTKLEGAKADLKDQKWEVDSAGGKIKVTINGSREILSVSVDKELVNPDDVESLQDVFVSAVNAALKLADEKINAATEEITGGMKIPGML